MNTYGLILVERRSDACIISLTAHSSAVTTILDPAMKDIARKSRESNKLGAD